MKLSAILSCLYSTVRKHMVRHDRNVEHVTPCNILANILSTVDHPARLWNSYSHKHKKTLKQTQNIEKTTNARGQMWRKREWGSFVCSEFGSWPLNKLALQRWAALTMIYGRNTIHRCYELAGSGADTHTRARKDTYKHSKAIVQTDTHKHTQSRGSGQANSILLTSRQIQF